MLERLRQPFPAKQVKKNQNGMDYVSIDGYINRLLDVSGPDYSFRIKQSSVELLPAELKTSTGKYQYLAQVTAELTIVFGNGTPDINASTRAGVGADVSFDPDKAVKTAQAEAFKKAAHQFGIALELWDEEHRAVIARQRRVDSSSESSMKQETFRIARERLGKPKPSAAEVAKVFGRKATEMSDPDVLREILTAEGVL